MYRGLSLLKEETLGEAAWSFLVLLMSPVGHADLAPLFLKHVPETGCGFLWAQRCAQLYGLFVKPCRV